MINFRFFLIKSTNKKVFFIKCNYRFAFFYHNFKIKSVNQDFLVFFYYFLLKVLKVFSIYNYYHHLYLSICLLQFAS